MLHKETVERGPLKGLTFFQDIQFEEPVQLFTGKFKWKKVEKRLHEMVIKTNNVFPPLRMN